MGYSPWGGKESGMTVSTAQHICILYPTYFKNPQPFASSSSKKKEKEQEEKKMKEKDRDKEEEEKDKYYDPRPHSFPYTCLYLYASSSHYW